MLCSGTVVDGVAAWKEPDADLLYVNGKSQVWSPQTIIRALEEFCLIPTAFTTLLPALLRAHR
jgi:hypothetical protein